MRLRPFIVKQLDYDLTPVAGLALVGHHLERISLYTSPLRLKLARKPDASGEVKNALHAQPDGLDSGLAITRSRQKTAKPGDQAHHLIEVGGLSGNFCLFRM